jgi:hypothetical protein
MKFPKPVFLVFLTSVLAFSCKKDQTTKSTTTSMLFGKWSIVNEEFTWINPATGMFYDSIYQGKPDDYYEFTPDGNLFAKEGIYHDSATYYFVNRDQIQTMPRIWNGVTVSSPGGVYGPEFTISVLTENSLILSSSALTPEGPASDSITLKR